MCIPPLGMQWSLSGVALKKLTSVHLKCMAVGDHCDNIAITHQFSIIMKKTSNTF